MSWEEMSSREHACPCGEGTYTVRIFGDDWFRSEERWEMQCQRCREEFELLEFAYFDSGMQVPAFRWIPRQAALERKSRQEALQERKTKLERLAQIRYRGAWLAHFADARSKKAVWERLTLGEGYPSLSTFYAHTRNSPVEDYLTGYFSFNRIATVLATLEITDAEIANELREIETEEDSLRLQFRQLIREGHA